MSDPNPGLEFVLSWASQLAKAQNGGSKEPVPSSCVVFQLFGDDNGKATRKADNEVGHLQCAKTKLEPSMCDS